MTYLKEFRYLPTFDLYTFDINEWIIFINA